MKFIQVGILFVLVASPLAFGSVEPWAYSLINLLALLFLLVWATRRIVSKNSLPIRVPGPLFLMIAFVGLGILQIIPLPITVIHILSPARAAFLSRLNWREFASQVPSHTTLSVDPYLTSLALVNLVCLLIYFFLTTQLLQKSSDRVGLRAPGPVNLCADPEENPAVLGVLGDSGGEDIAEPHAPMRHSTPPFLKTLVFTIIITGSVIALFGIVQKLSGTDKIYWVRTLTHGGSLMGPFVNRDHFAGFLEMPFGLVLGLLIFLKRQVPYWWLLAFSGVVMGTAIFYSGSRGGMLCFAFQLVAAAILFYSSRDTVLRPLTDYPLEARASLRRLAPLLVITGLLVAVILSVAYVGPEAVLGRLQDKISEDERLPVWRDTLHMAASYPVFGSGLGSFRSVFPHFESRDYTSRYLQAHNDYLQLLSETGLLGAALLLVSVVWVVLRGFLNYDRGSQFSMAARLGAILGILGILLHSFFDFNLQITSNALLFAVCCGIVLGSIGD